MRSTPAASVHTSSDPSLQFSHDKLTNDIHAAFAVVQTGDKGKLFPAIGAENVGILDADFFQRFKTIGGKARRDHGDG